MRNYTGGSNVLNSLLPNAYKVKIDVFEGPLDLLFHLIEKNKINIYDIPISVITDQYMDYVLSAQKMDLELASEFLLMASTLLHIKSRILLPSKKDKEQEEGEVIDPREELVVRLIEYKKYKELALKLQERELNWSKVFYKLPEHYNMEDNKRELDVDVKSLTNAYLSIVGRNKLKENKRTNEIQQILQKDKVTIKSKIKHIMNLLSNRKHFVFGKIFSSKEKSITEVVTAFLALLVVVKSGKANIEQNNQYSDIFVNSQE